MANTLLNIGQITREALATLENLLPMVKNVNRQYSDQYARDGAKVGDSISIRKPPRYVGRTGPLLQVESTVETATPLTLSQAGCDISFSTKDMTLSIDDFKENFLVPAMATVAANIELAGMQQYKNIYNVVGTPGTLPTSTTLSNANALLDANLAPMDGRRSIILEPYATANLVQDTKGLFQDSSTIAEQYESGRFARGFGFNAMTGQLIPTHTAGAQGGTPLVNGVQTGSSLVTDGWTAAAAPRLKAGDTFTIANVYAVNPYSRLSTGKLQSFLVTSDVSSDGSGNATIPISPAIVTSGQYQTVDSAPPDNAPLTITSGTSAQVSKQNLAFHPDAFTFASADMWMPDSGVVSAERVRSKSSKISMRAIRFYDGNTDQAPLRLDVLYGWATLRPELAVRVEG